MFEKIHLPFQSRRKMIKVKGGGGGGGLQERRRGRGGGAGGGGAQRRALKARVAARGIQENV
jgi:hypothetical protein